MEKLYTVIHDTNSLKQLCTFMTWCRKYIWYHSRQILHKKWFVANLSESVNHITYLVKVQHKLSSYQKRKKKKANCLYHSPGRSNHCNVAIYNKIQEKLWKENKCNLFLITISFYQFDWLYIYALCVFIITLVTVDYRWIHWLYYVYAVKNLLAFILF